MKNQHSKNSLYGVLFAVLLANVALSIASAPVVAADPSFDCNKAQRPDEFAICTSNRLSALDELASFGYNSIRNSVGRQQANEANLPHIKDRIECMSNANCIQRTQLLAIRTFQRMGAPISEYQIQRALIERIDTRTTAVDVAEVQRREELENQKREEENRKRATEWQAAQQVQEEQRRIAKAEETRLAALKQEVETQKLELARIVAEKAKTELEIVKIRLEKEQLAAQESERQRQIAEAQYKNSWGYWFSNWFRSDEKLRNDDGKAKINSNANSSANQPASAVAPAPVPVAQVPATTTPTVKVETYQNFLNNWDNHNFVECYVAYFRGSALSMGTSNQEKMNKWLREIISLKMLKIQAGSITAEEFDKRFQAINREISPGDMVLSGRGVDWYNKCGADTLKGVELSKITVPSPQPMNPMPPAIPKINFQQGITYNYFGDGGCTSRANEVCMNLADYQAACRAAKGVTQHSLKTRGVLADPDEQALLNGGSLENTRIMYDVSRSGASHCYAIVTMSGIVDGTSKRLQIQGIVQSFIVDNRNQILVSYFNLL